LGVAEPVAEFYAFGPSSNNNDGARCALAPIVSVDSPDIDFGDAPDSYGTSLAQNGARHDLGAGQLYLGDTVDGESDAYLSPLSDDSADSSNDEDGVQFVSALEIGEPAIVIATASADAFLNAWIDWDRSGTFEDSERIADQLSVSAGVNNLSIETPLWADPGPTWARFRLSSQANVGPSGGVSDGEVEDYAVSINASGVTESYYPSAGTMGTFAYEDNWPIQGDYDLNDLVVRMGIRELRRDGNPLGLELSGEITAVGGVYHNGFAVRLPGVPASAVNTQQIDYRINGQLQSGSPIESGSNELILVIAEDAWNYVSPGEDCVFYRTESGCEADVQMRFVLRIGFNDSASAAGFPAAPYDPFMFAAPGYFHGPLFDSPPGRGKEIHLPGQTPTERFNTAFLGLGDDRSDAEAGEYFRTESGMPWALHVGNEWLYPLEFTDVALAYPLFESYVQSAGQNDADWLPVG
ncbi:MAG: LruC domain-containing protein, partial [Pseudomonadota bacterium]